MYVEISQVPEQVPAEQVPEQVPAEQTSQYDQESMMAHKLHFSIGLIFFVNFLLFFFPKDTPFGIGAYLILNTFMHILFAIYAHCQSLDSFFIRIILYAELILVWFIYFYYLGRKT